MRHYRNFTQAKSFRKPFWIPASSFYVLVAGFAAASFFFVIGIMHDDGREPEIVTAGLVASGVLVSGVVLRELVLRNARERFIAERRILDINLKAAVARVADQTPRKLTIERNDAAIRLIRTKSEAAMVFDNIAHGHREVFELCAEYRKLVASEIRNIHPNSPRLKALIKGNEYALKTHKFHIMRWAELESKSLAGGVQTGNSVEMRTSYAERAKRPLETALMYYPDEPALRDSLDILDELIVTIRLNAFIRDAESASSRGDRGSAEVIYGEALKFIEIQKHSVSLANLRDRIETALLSLQG